MLVIADERANRKFGMIGIHGAKRAYKRNYTFRNIRIEGPTAAALLYFDASGSKFSNILLEHIAAEDLHGYEGLLSASNGGSLHGVRIKDLRMKGKIIESLSQGNIQVDGAVTGVTFNN